ncbi:hypothetical protein F5X68DRAFT_244953 [Plectosphaerella plurivora]|uniref:Uncharacterized protein n=1 Tax=Plectosphaerella plurivora TaxID=936078 RepID=A0A9P9A7U2_9PEZI|nr:hypothetical protein F5X68DRAFT_244953 [Plectosphaerella plurivora]
MEASELGTGLPVYTGVWRNANQGDANSGPFSLTLTVTQPVGAFLTAFLALFVSVAMTNLWSIACLFIHLFRSTTAPRSVLHHQQQALLSNTHSPGSTIATLLKLGKTWRGVPVKGTISSSLVLLTTATTYLAILSAAGLFSSRVQRGNEEVLVIGRTCGWLGRLANRQTEGSDLSEEEFMNHRAATMAWGRWTATQSLNYFRNCYSDSGLAGNSNVCRLFTTKSIPVKSEGGVDCPFANEVCEGGKSAIRLDTGLIDSNRDLGINSSPGDRLWFRRVMTCVPVLAEEKYSTDWETTVPAGIPSMEGDRYKYYNVGSYAGNDFSWARSNYSLSLGSASTVYDLEAITSYAGAEPSNISFVPIPELQVADADVTMLWLSNNARYLTPVEDAWFRATNKTDPTGANRPNPEGHYISDRVMSSLGCTASYQFCNTPNSCSPLQGLRQNTGEFRGLPLTTTQKAIYNLVESMAMSASLENGVYFLGSQILSANDFLWTGAGSLLSSGLVSTHWATEVTNIANLMLAAMQRLVLDYAALPEFSILTTRGQKSSLDFVQQPANEGERELCSMVRVRDASYTNFSVVGLAIILGPGLFVILLNLFVFPAALFWVRDKLRLDPYPRWEWHRGHLFMQQQDALKFRGVGPWNVRDGPRSKWLIPWTVAMVDGQTLCREDDVVASASGESRDGTEYHRYKPKS